MLSHLEGSRQFTWRAELDFVHSVLCTVLRTIVTEAQGSALEPGKRVTKERRKYGTKNKNQNAKEGKESLGGSGLGLVPLGERKFFRDKTDSKHQRQQYPTLKLEPRTRTRTPIPGKAPIDAVLVPLNAMRF